MTRSPNIFRQTDLTRAIKGARNAGVEVARAEIATDGKITLVIGDTSDGKTGLESTADDELERWRRSKNAD
jgi:hypothetical protein